MTEVIEERFPDGQQACTCYETSSEVCKTQCCTMNQKIQLFNIKKAASRKTNSPKTNKK